VKPVQRNEIVDYATYEDSRAAFRDEVMKVKSVRRVHVGDCLTLLFENPLTIRYQVQEMIRAERIVRESDIVHELQTYNELLGGDGELGCTLLIEIEDPAERDRKLSAWWQLPEKLTLVLEDGTEIRAVFDERQRTDGRISSVHYLKFDTGGRVPVAIRVDLPEMRAETKLTPDQRAALSADI